MIQLFLIGALTLMVTASPQSYLRSDDGREYRDNYGYYRYIQGIKLYVECHDRYYDARKDDCGAGSFRSRTGDEYDIKYDALRFDGSGKYRIQGRLRNIRYGGTKDMYRFYRERYETGSGSTCPYSNYESDALTGVLSALTHPTTSSYPSEPDPADNDAVIISAKSQIRRARILVPGQTLTTSLNVKGQNKPGSSVAFPTANSTDNEISHQKIRTKRYLRTYYPTDTRRYYDYRDRYPDDYNRRRYDTTRGVSECSGREKCEWEAELVCNLDDHLNSVRYLYTRRPAVKWTRVFDSHYPRGRYNDIYDYFGSRAYLKNDGETLIITKVYPEDKGTYICEYDDSLDDRYRSTVRGRKIRKEVRFYPRYPDFQGC
ncbi:hypothetical protein TCAL_07888 [Tigriopus californicus]|uniref:Ig-like domain-containing protein n=1 Tax=Tigriopus californicus TaxID=6832 RepID=A0A553P838_TIGCA|nr:uncharacterized protein LOC131878283 [Tigriopus californicus]TRY73852.1 hypothetical protein TCAL_07888 [Tigriopus californicus]|eukprot:TCALIF_07888-PA protein Name:"Protein of unknown function" AED:0.01 eAED:0.01 QI:62/1/0.83/1/0.8/0.83/6/0/372